MQSSKSRTKVVLNFDTESLSNLEQMSEEKRHKSIGETVQESLAINRALQAQKEQGFSEFIVRDPRTGRERVMTLLPLENARMPTHANKTQ